MTLVGILVVCLALPVLLILVGVGWLWFGLAVLRRIFGG